MTFLQQVAFFSPRSVVFFETPSPLFLQFKVDDPDARMCSSKALFRSTFARTMPARKRWSGSAGYICPWHGKPMAEALSPVCGLATRWQGPWAARFCIPDGPDDPSDWQSPRN
jgi:hypothetical protein